MEQFFPGRIPPEAAFEAPAGMRQPLGPGIAAAAPPAVQQRPGRGRFAAGQVCGQFVLAGRQFLGQQRAHPGHGIGAVMVDRHGAGIVQDRRRVIARLSHPLRFDVRRNRDAADPAQGSQQGGRSDGFAEKIVESRRQQPAALVGAIVGGQRDGPGRRPVFAPGGQDSPPAFHAVHARHVQVHEQYVGRIGRRLFNGIGAIPGGIQSTDSLGQHRVQEFPVDRIVVDGQDVQSVQSRDVGR